jgi:hypothetical protein
MNAAGERVLLAPSSLFREGSEVQVYYEVRGSRTNQNYRHEITIFRDAGPRRSSSPPLVAVSFEEAATDQIIRSSRRVQLEGLKQGDYVVEVKITGPDGETQVRRRSLKLISR